MLYALMDLSHGSPATCDKFIEKYKQNGKLTEEDFNIQWSNTDYSFEDRDHARAMLATKGKFVGYNGKEVIFQTQTPWSDFCNGGGTYKLIEETSGLYKYGDEIK